MGFRRSLCSRNLITPWWPMCWSTSHQSANFTTSVWSCPKLTTTKATPTPARRINSRISGTSKQAHPSTNKPKYWCTNYLTPWPYKSNPTWPTCPTRPSSAMSCPWELAAIWNPAISLSFNSTAPQPRNLRSSRLIQCSLILSTASESASAAWRCIGIWLISTLGPRMGRCMFMISWLTTWGLTRR